MNEDVSNNDILLAIAELSNKFNSFERNIIALVENKVPENDVIEQGTATEEIDAGTFCSEDIFGASNVLVDRKTTLSYLLCTSVGALGFRYPTYGINVRKAKRAKGSKRRMLPIAGKLWFIEDKSDYFKPFKELTQHTS